MAKRRRDTDQEQADLERARVAALPVGPLCSMCVGRHVAEIGDVCTKCAETWGGPARAQATKAIDEAG